MSRYGKQPRFGTPYIRTTPEGAEVTETHENVGYGFTHYTIVGDAKSVTAEQDRIYRSWPPQGYSTIVYWPPEQCAKFTEDVRPVEMRPGIWQVKGWRANSCD